MKQKKALGFTETRLMSH